MSKLTTAFILLGAAFAAVHATAISLNLYWYYPWFDILMHFWGGVLIALGVQTLSHLRLFPARISKRHVLSVGLLFIFGWEIFEFGVGVTSLAPDVLDTIGDIVVGFLGVMVGYQIVKRR